MFQFTHPLSGAGLMHSADLDDMRAAILDDGGEEDDDGPDGGSPFITAKGTGVTITCGNKVRRA